MNEHTAKVDAARDEIGRAVSRYIEVSEADAYVTAWVVGVEWTTMQREKERRAARQLIAPIEQTISAAEGLGHFIAGRYR